MAFSFAVFRNDIAVDNAQEGDVFHGIKCRKGKRLLKTFLHERAGLFFVVGQDYPRQRQKPAGTAAE